MGRDKPSDLPNDITMGVIYIAICLILFLFASGAAREWIQNPLDAKPMYYFENGGELK